MILLGKVKGNDNLIQLYDGELIECETFAKSFLEVGANVELCITDDNGTIIEQIKDEILGDPNSRCFVTADRDKVYKYYKKLRSFENEKASYNLLKGLEFVPTVYEINDSEKCIVMERIKGKSLQNGAVIPSSFLDDMMIIYDTLVERGISNFTDFLKPEHIFVDTNCSTNTHGIRVIDFDIYPPIAPEDERHLNAVEKSKKSRSSIISDIKNSFNI